MILGGFWLGRVSWVSQHMSVLTLMIVAISVVPVGIQWSRARRSSTKR